MQDTPAAPRPHPSLSVIVYAHQDFAAIHRAVLQAQQTLTALPVDYEILVIEETERMGALQAFLAKERPLGPISCVPVAGRSDYAAALKTGMEVCQSDLVAITTGALDLAALSYLVTMVKHFPIVCGNRLDRGGSLFRRCVRGAVSGLARMTLGTRVRDGGGAAAISLFQRSALRDVLPESQGLFANLEVLARARQCGLAVAEVDVLCSSHAETMADGASPGPCRRGESTPDTALAKNRWRLPMLTAGQLVRALAEWATFWWSRVQFPGPTPAPAAKTSWILGLLVLVLAGLLLFPKLNQPLLDPDEGRQAEIPREMLAHHDLLVPRMQGEPYYEKPPLQYWLTAGAYAAFGTRSGSARLIPALSAWLAVLLTYAWGWGALGARPAFLGALGLCLSPGFIILGRTVVLDSLLATCVLAAWYAAYTAVCRPTLRWGWWLASALACGFGILAKGPVALILLIPPVWVYQRLTPGVSRPGWKSWGAYVGIALGIAAPWYVVMAFQEPGYLEQFIWRANVLRFVNPFDHEQPWWFYVPILFVVTFPWSLLWPALGYFLASRNVRLARLRTPALGFCAGAFGWCLLFYSLSGCKSPPYLAPLFAPLALLLGACLEAVLFRKIGRHDHYLSLAREALPRWAALWVLTIGASCYLAAAVLGWQDYRFALAKAVLAWIAALLWWRFSRGLRATLAWFACALAALVLITMTSRDLRVAYASRHTPAPMARFVRHLLKGPKCPVVSYGRQWPSAAFYFRRDMVQFFGEAERQHLVEFVCKQPKTAVLVERGPLLDDFLRALPDTLRTQVHLPAREGQVALVVVWQRTRPGLALGR